MLSTVALCLFAALALEYLIVFLLLARFSAPLDLMEFASVLLVLGTVAGGLMSLTVVLLGYSLKIAVLGFFSGYLVSPVFLGAGFVAESIERSIRQPR